MYFLCIIPFYRYGCGFQNNCIFLSLLKTKPKAWKNCYHFCVHVFGTNTIFFRVWYLVFCRWKWAWSLSVFSWLDANLWRCRSYITIFKMTSCFRWQALLKHKNILFGKLARLINLTTAPCKTGLCHFLFCSEHIQIWDTLDNYILKCSCGYKILSWEDGINKWTSVQVVVRSVSTATWLLANEEQDEDAEPEPAPSFWSTVKCRSDHHQAGLDTHFETV